MSISTPRLIAFYLPQYHPIPENDAWWGKGFTEWTNVTRARPLFADHYQPHLPADLGFYDLRLPEVRHAQVEMARSYSISGFCYYHYWFNGRRLLERPFSEVLMSGQPDFPFCLCWANENWSRRWDGGDQQLLVTQDYSSEDDRQHLQALAPSFSDPRYIRVDGKPLFLVYKASQLPTPRKTTDIWREEAQRLGVGELFLCRVQSHREEFGNPILDGFDAAVEFQPDWYNLVNAKPAKQEVSLASSLSQAFKKLKLRFSPQSKFKKNYIFNYAEVVQQMLAKEPVSYRRFPCVFPSWDNSARRTAGGATIFYGSTPQLYEQWLTTVVERELAQPQAMEEAPIIFINAWNEWAEGCHLEPCQKWGRGYLDATKQALEKAKDAAPQEPPASTSK